MSLKTILAGKRDNIISIQPTADLAAAGKLLSARAWSMRTPIVQQ